MKYISPKKTQKAIKFIFNKVQTLFWRPRIYLVIEGKSHSIEYESNQSHLIKNIK